MASQPDLVKLCANARSYGASAAATLVARNVVLDPRVRFKCLVPRCDSYGQNLMCPPHVLGMGEFATILGRYENSIVIQCPIPLDQEFMKGREGKDIETVYREKEYYDRMISSERKFMNLLYEVERDAQKMGYRFAAALTGGACRLCDECVGIRSGEKCRHPFRARPSMEALGIDVFQTAKNAGIPFEIPPRDRPVWTGLLLVD